MEYVEGSSLRSMLRSGPLDVQFVVTLLLQIAAGLEAVHAEGIVHRDLKPENILVSKKGEVKIGDFGVARLSNAQSVTHVNALVGTADYVAPEYIETGECDARGDIYAVGVIGYEMLAGHSPFPAVQSAAALAERFATKPQPLFTAAPRCPRNVAAVIERAMEHKLAARYQSATELRAALKNVHEHMWAEHDEDLDSVTATLTHAPEPLVATMRLDPGIVKAAQARPSPMPLWIGAAALAALLAVGGALLSTTLQRPPPQDQNGNIQAERERFLGP
jgi:serine/threonine protein kinase